LACGSGSTSRTAAPRGASATPRLSVVVVFPTPPFCMASARTRGGRRVRRVDITALSHECTVASTKKRVSAIVRMCARSTLARHPRSRTMAAPPDRPRDRPAVHPIRPAAAQTADEWPDPPDPEAPAPPPRRSRAAPKPPPPQTDPVELAAERMVAQSFDARAHAIHALLAARRNGDAKPLGTRFEQLNRALGGGFWPGMYLVVGSTGSGKSQLALQMALDAAQAGTPVMYVALELDETHLYARAAGYLRREAGKWSEFFHGHKPVPEDVPAALAALPFHWDVSPPHGWDPAQIALSA